MLVSSLFMDLIAFRNKKIVALSNEQSTSTPWVYAIGDVMADGLELTPVAIQAGRFLMRRLYNHGTQMVCCFFHLH